MNEKMTKAAPEDLQIGCHLQELVSLGITPQLATAPETRDLFAALLGEEEGKPFRESVLASLTPEERAIFQELLQRSQGHYRTSELSELLADLPSDIQRLRQRSFVEQALTLPSPAAWDVRLAPNEKEHVTEAHLKLVNELMSLGHPLAEHMGLRIQGLTCFGDAWQLAQDLDVEFRSYTGLPLDMRFMGLLTMALLHELALPIDDDRANIAKAYTPTYEQVGQLGVMRLVSDMTRIAEAPTTLQKASRESTRRRSASSPRP